MESKVKSQNSAKLNFSDKQYFVINCNKEYEHADAITQNYHVKMPRKIRK